jgi:hypothetical protein
MDENIINNIIIYLSAKDLVMFAQVNTLTYQFCKHTNINKQLCQSVHHSYHYVLTLLEHARLEYCMTFLNDVYLLALNMIPMHKFCLSLTLKKTCGAKIHILIGRCIVINQIMYAHSHLDFLAESQSKMIKDEYNVLLIEHNMERLQHKVNSIISHKYENIQVKMLDHIKEGYKRELVNSLQYIHCFAKCCSVFASPNKTMKV